MPKGVPDPTLPARIGQGTSVGWAKRHNSRHLVDLARKHTEPALRKLVDIMNGKAGKMKVVVGESIMEIDIEVPAAVQLKAAELIIERGYGKAPQAILLGTESPLGTDGARALSVAEKILAIKAARENRGSTVDLEASQQDEAVTVEAVEVPPAAEELI